MKKSLIALAVAGTFAAPAYAATANVDVYGRLNVSIEDSNGDGVTPQVTDRQSIIGFKGTEDLGGGLKGIWQIESTISGNADGVGGGTLAGRNSFVGLSGSFGTVLIGRHDTPYRLATGRLDPFSDTLADYNGDGGGLPRHNPPTTVTNKDDFTQLVHNVHDHRSNNAVAYVSPNLSGFTLSAAVVMTNRNDTAADNEGNGTADAYSLSATYAQGPLFAALAYQHVDDLSTGTGAAAVEETPAWKLGLGYSFGDTRLGFVYEDVEGKNTAGAKLLDRQSWLINVVHNMGPIALKAQYGQVDDKMAANLDQTKFSLGADYSLSKRTTTGVVYTADSTDNNTTGSLSAWGVYVRHTF